MEIIVFEQGLANPFTSLETMNLAKLADKIVQSSEDYVFVLSPDEWSKWRDLHASTSKRLLKRRTTEEKWQVLSLFIEENRENSLALISLVSAHPTIGKSYKLESLTPSVLGDCYAIFFAKEEQVMERSEEVTREISRIKERQGNKPSLS